MKRKLITPKFLTQELIHRTVDNVVSMVFKNYPELKRKTIHVVVVVPSYESELPGETDVSGSMIRPHRIYQKSFGNMMEWEHPFDDIARCKSDQLWYEFNPGNGVKNPPAHLMFPNWTPYWGGDKKEGLVVACSGVQPHFDKMISGMILSGIIGLAEHAWETSEEKESKQDFL